MLCRRSTLLRLEAIDNTQTLIKQNQPDDR